MRSREKVFTAGVTRAMLIAAVVGAVGMGFSRPASAQQTTPCFATGGTSPATSSTGGGGCSGTQADTFVYNTNHFDTTQGRNSVNIVNPIFVNPSLPAAQQDLCAMIYVFDQSEQMQECCGCQLTANGLRTLHADPNLATSDLTSNPFSATPGTLNTGVIKILSTTSGGALAPSASSPFAAISPGHCDPAIISHTGVDTDNGGLANSLLSYSTHVYHDSVSGVTGVTEVAFEPAVLSNSATPSSSGAFGYLPDSELADLTDECAFIAVNGTGRGICSCGTGDNM